MPVQQPDTAPELIVQRPLHTSLAASLLLHALILFLPGFAPPEAVPASQQDSRPTNRIEARLAPRQPPQRVVPPAAAQRPLNSSKRPKLPAQPKLLTSKTPVTNSAQQRQWSVAERDEMNKFLRDLDQPPKPVPSLAQRSLAMAREAGRQQARQDEGDRELLERIPNSPPVDPFSLQMYLDGLVSKLNRSAAFVRNDPRSRGVKTAAVLIRLNPNGSLRSFQILNAADQQDEIAFIKSVVERAVPFPAFPPKLVESAKSLGMLICITPANSGDGGFGFSRVPDGQRC